MGKRTIDFLHKGVLCLFIFFQLLDSVETPLSTDQGVSNSNTGSAVGFLSNGELIQGMYGPGVFMFQFPLSMFCPVLPSEGAPAL